MNLPNDSDAGDMMSNLKNLILGSSPKEKRRKDLLTVPLAHNEMFYKMNHKYRGFALILNHIDFHPDIKKREQFGRRDPGTIEDARRLEKTFRELGFEVIIHDDEKLTVKKVQSALKDLSRKDFTECDCLIIVVLSHGGTDKIFAYDQTYQTDLLIEYFTPDQCAGLVGKPKILVLNLCQGDKRDSGVDVRVETDSGGKTGNVQIGGSGGLLTYRLPLSADFLLACSTVPGYVSYRQSDGSCYVKAFCDVFDKYATRWEITTLLTFINNRVAMEFDTVKMFTKLKQMPSFTCTFTRLLIFNAEIRGTFE